MNRLARFFVPIAFFLPALGASAQGIPGLDASLQSAADTSAQSSIPASPVDLLFDANSYVPPFYLGRALPSPGSVLRLHAIPHLTPHVPDSDITYTWRRDGAVVGAISGKGKSSVSIAGPTLFAADTISVDAVSADGTSYGSASVVIPSIDPQLTLYEDHPLFGIEYYNALLGQSSIPDLEMTFAAVPYFAAVSGPSDPSLNYAWIVNGASVAASATSSNEITINADNSSGVAAIAASLTSSVNFLLDASGAWNVLFSRGGAGQAQGSGTSGGVFHTGINQ